MAENIDDSAAQLNAWYSAMSSFGECIVWFQHIEITLCTCISALAGMTEEIGQIVTSEMSFRVRVTTYSALAQHLVGQDPLPEDLAELVKRLRWAEEER